jgi:hypothetical protein
MGADGWADGAAGGPGAAGQCKGKKDWLMMDQVGDARLSGVPMDMSTLPGPAKHPDSATSSGESLRHYPMKTSQAEASCGTFHLLETNGSSIAPARFRHVAPLFQPMLLVLREG